MRGNPGFRRRRLSMTPLIDVIFLLLLFFMLSSTFSKFGEIALTHAAAGGGAAGDRPLFVQLGEDRLALNARPVPLAALRDALTEGRVLVSLDPGTSAQRLVDLLAVLRLQPDLAVTVLE